MKTIVEFGVTETGFGRNGAREDLDNCAFLGYYAARCGNS